VTLNSVAVECGENVRLRLIVWITGLQAGNHAHGELWIARFARSISFGRS
jgi:hypothetical protein